VVNPTESAQTVDLSVKGVALRGSGRVWVMTGPDLTTATGLNRQEVQVRESPLAEAPKALSVAPISISIFEFEKQ
jgi:alpha-N-arabinofuranosidase